MSETVVIDERFEGPVRHANGGYTSGLLASRLGGAASVRLRKMTPTEKPLRITAGDRGMSLFDGETLLAEAEPGTPELDVPPPVSLDAVELAVQRSPALSGNHGAPGCFGCGPQQPPGRGLRQFPGPIGDTGLSGAHWTAPVDLTDGEGHTPVEVVWAALDCPGGWALGIRGVLGPDAFPALTRQTAEVLAPTHPGERLVTLAWPVESDPARPEAGTAVYGADGTVRAVAHLVHAPMPKNWAQG